MKEKVQLTENAMNSIENGAVLYEKDTKVESIALLVKGRVELVADGISMVLGTGNFLGACDVEKAFLYILCKRRLCSFCYPGSGDGRY